MLTVVSWWWRSSKGYRKQFRVEHVNMLRELVAEHCSLSHEFVCVTDQPEAAFDPRVRVVRLWGDHAELPGAWALGPSCWRRLRLFAPEAHELLDVPRGATVVSLDLDSVPVGWLDALWDRRADFVGWYATHKAPSCGSMFLHRLGTLPRVWEDFSYLRAITESKARGFTGTDQAWIACNVAGKFPVWTTADGVYSFKNDCLPRGGGMPSDARVVFFHGKPDPWDADVRREHPWIAKKYPMEASSADLRIQGTL